MGSIVSFPVLCLANAAICRWSCELADRRIYTLRDARLMVNGDDCTMRAHKSVYRFWQRISTFIGLKESVGKTYVSRKFLDINSTNFQRTDEPKDIQYQRKDNTVVTRKTHLSQTRYVNVGLVKGLKRSQGRIGLNDQGDERNNMSARARELLRLSPPGLSENVMKTFINYHRDVLDKTRLPWFIPEWLGGVGLPIGKWGEPSDLDLRIARRIILNWKTQRPIPLSHKDVTWKTWLMAQERLPEPLYTTTKGPHTEAYTRAVALKCVDLLFDSKVELNDLFSGIQEGTRVHKAISHNAKLWKVEGGLPQPLNLTDLEFSALYPNWVHSSPPPHPTKVQHHGAVYDLD